VIWLKIKGKKIHLSVHCSLRILERGLSFGLDYEETKERIFQTLKYGNISKRKHNSHDWLTYKRYFHDNLSFYVVFGERKNIVMIKTIIIEKGKG
jgi:hypothetical protein